MFPWLMFPITWGGTPLSGSTPFTYRNAWTQIEWLHHLTKAVKLLFKRADDTDEALAKLTATIEARFASERVFTDQKLAEMETRLTKLIVQANAEGMVRDPTSGQMRPVGLVIDRVYDYVRVFAEFALEKDEKGLTAGKLDAIGMMARFSDLAIRKPTVNEQDSEAYAHGVK